MAQTAWMKHLLAFKAKHNGMSLGEAMKKAKHTYNNKSNKVASKSKMVTKKNKKTKSSKVMKSKKSKTAKKSKMPKKIKK